MPCTAVPPDYRSATGLVEPQTPAAGPAHDEFVVADAFENTLLVYAANAPASQLQRLNTFRHDRTLARIGAGWVRTCCMAVVRRAWGMGLRRGALGTLGYDWTCC